MRDVKRLIRAIVVAGVIVMTSAALFACNEKASDREKESPETAVITTPSQTQGITEKPTEALTETPSPSPTATPTPSPTATPTPTPTPTPVPTPTPKPI